MLWVPDTPAVAPLVKMKSRGSRCGSISKMVASILKALGSIPGIVHSRGGGALLESW